METRNRRHAELRPAPASGIALALLLTLGSAAHAQTSQATNAPKPEAAAKVQPAAPAASTPTATPPAAPAAAAAAPSASSDAARQVAASVQSFYDQTKDLSASFFQTYVNKVYDRTDRSSGKVTFKKPGRMRWDYAKPNGKVIVAAQGKFTLYEPGEEPGEAGQVIEQNFQESDLPQAMAFLMGTGKLSDDFDFKLLDSAREGYPNGQVLELKPRKPNPHFDHLVFYVETSASLRGLVRRLVIIDSTGNRNRFDFSDLKFNTGTPDSTFTWKAPANARRVHM
jgi:outer membrane lipoprotein carrier protein